MTTPILASGAVWNQCLMMLLSVVAESFVGNDRLALPVRERMLAGRLVAIAAVVAGADQLAVPLDWPP
jgi:hypothetical protein